ncbi:MAG: 2,3-bisphosphoglycerate-dependent phosphoglycerate mutase [Bacteriovoracaceae bacterium]|nr:2,3-bisphosphoglycerate-dependent phosphoglycerate mutase [Bacteriovoracaceae bacterium]
MNNHSSSSTNYKIYLIRHGQSEWNAKDLFTGWVDVPLSSKGIEEAMAAGQLFLKENIQFDLVVTSILQRAIKTAWLILEQMQSMAAPQKCIWEFNERHYGGLQGKNKTQMRSEFGEEQVKIWRRSYQTRPPEITQSQPSLKFAQGLKEVPKSESLEDTVNRVIKGWNEKIVPEIKQNKTLLISAHGNSLRALIKHLENISDEKIVELEIPTGRPIEIILDRNFKGIERRFLA